MNCKICGGNLTFNNYMYVCDSCGTQQTIASFFENTDVFICYIENDMQGKRTRDSVIAQDVYNKLQNANINTFYQRISAANLIGAELEAAYIKAIKKARVVLVIGTDSDNFDTLLDENEEYLSSKTIVPVYSMMNAYDLPARLSNLQAVNYDNIGAIAVLTKNILKILGRENELNTVKLISESRKKRNKIIIATTLGIFLILLTTVFYIVLCTPYILKTNKYSYAEKLTEQGNYTKAAEIFATLGKYKNAKNYLKNIYDKYSGYYNTDDESYSINFRIRDNANAAAEVIYFDRSQKQVKFTSESVIEHNSFNFQFIDNQGNQGACQISLIDNGINFSLKTEIINSELFIPNREETFNISQKSDAPLTPKLDKQTIINWLKTGLTTDILNEQGYELEYCKQLGNGNAGELYKIKNTDIFIEIGNSNAMALEIPADIIIPEEIGKNTKYINNDGILYIPYGKADLGIRITDESGKTITETTQVAVTSELFCENMNTNGYDNWDKVLFDSIFEYELCKDVEKRYVTCSSFEILQKKESVLLVATEIFNIYFKDICAYYKVNMDSGEFAFIKELPNNVSWQNDSELFEAFK
ncbi:MAG: hypothetical protein ACI4RF_08680 [Eubacterium sp.]